MVDGKRDSRWWRGALGALGAAVCLLNAGPAGAGEYYPLETEEARTVGQGNLRTELEVGVRKQNDASELYNVPTVRVEYGIGEWADLELEWDVFAVQDTDIPAFRPKGTVTKFNQEEFGPGDLRLRLKVVPYHTAYGDFGWHVETKFPNADDREGLGTDGTDFAARFLHSVSWDRFTDAPVLSNVTTHLNVGVALEAQPGRSSEQNDLFIWGAAAAYPLTERLTLMGELTGAEGHSSVRNIAEGAHGDDSTVGRLGLTGDVGPDWTWGLTAAKGLGAGAPDWELQVGVSRTWDVGYERPPARNASPEMRWIDPEAVMSYYNPLWTEEAQVMGPHRVRGELEFGYVRQADGSDLYRVPEATVGWGIGPWADVEVEYEYLSVHDTNVVDDGRRIGRFDQHATETGDVRVHLKLVPWRVRIGDIGVHMTTKVPTAGDEHALGTDEADVVMRALLSSNWGSISSNAIVSRLTTHANIGMAIQETPFKRSKQEDIFIWGVAAEYNIVGDYTAWGELHGAAGNVENDNIAEGDYGDGQLVGRLGVTGPMRNIPLVPRYELFDDWRWGVTASAGLTHDSPEYGMQIGVSHTWGLN